MLLYTVTVTYMFSFYAFTFTFTIIIIVYEYMTWIYTSFSCVTITVKLFEEAYEQVWIIFIANSKTAQHQSMSQYWKEIRISGFH